MTVFLLAAALVAAQAGGTIAGRITDETGAALPGVTVVLEDPAGERITVSDGTGDYTFREVRSGEYRLAFTLINFASLRRTIAVDAGTTRADAVLHLSLNAEVTVTGTRMFANLADIENPAENLVGIAQSASQGAITSRQLEVRPVMRAGEVLETVPGVIITQHSGEGKANQYFLRGFNLDHGSDFATTVAGTPVNMPTHAHSQGYSDINFLIPELVTGVQFSKGPYFAEHGDFATAGASNINYATALDRPIAQVEGGSYDFARAFVAASPRVAGGHLLAALDVSTNSGPWSMPDSYRKVNAVVRYSRGDRVNGFTLTAMGYDGSWNATEASPRRAVAAGLIDRFGTLDDTDGGTTSRYSLSAEWQRGTNTALTRLSVYGLSYNMNLVSNFTFYLDDPEHGDQVEQVDHRFTTGVKLTHRRLARWGSRSMQNTFGVQIRNDDIPEVALYHTERRVRLETRSISDVLVSSAGAYVQNETEWSRWVRTLGGLRLDGSRYRVAALDPANSGTASAGLVSPKGGVTVGPWHGTEAYANAGMGFHSNNAIGTTITRDSRGNPVERVTPLVRGTGAEVGVRTVAVPRLQTTVSLWMLRLASELVYNGDLGATEPGPASRRHGIEITNYYSATPWLVLDGDVSFSRARFAEPTEIGQYVPEAVGTVVSAGASVNGLHNLFGSMRLRYFGPRTLIDDNSVRSEPTSLINVQAGYRISRRLRLTADLFNLLDAEVSDIDYYFASRLPGEPLEGVEDLHSHPAMPRTIRVSLAISM